MFKKENLLIKLCIILFCQHWVSDLISWLIVAAIWFKHGWKFGLLSILVKFTYGFVGLRVIRWSVKRHPLYYLRRVVKNLLEDKGYSEATYVVRTKITTFYNVRVVRHGKRKAVYTKTAKDA